LSLLKICARYANFWDHKDVMKAGRDGQHWINAFLGTGTKTLPHNNNRISTCTSSVVYVTHFVTNSTENTWIQCFWFYKIYNFQNLVTTIRFQVLMAASMKMNVPGMLLRVVRAIVLMMEAASPSETSVNVCQTTQPKLVLDSHLRLTPFLVCLKSSQRQLHGKWYRSCNYCANNTLFPNKAFFSHAQAS
jgi:hypothetical protein